MPDLTDEVILERVRQRAGLGAGAGGPTDEQIIAGVRGFAQEFRYWYHRVLEEKTLAKYQALLIDRINPMIRGMELEGLSTQEVAERIVHDYARRLYVTAGGWGLEKLAIEGSPRLRKSSAAGIDAEWHEGGPPPVVNLYVIKSSTVTRNSDILKQLKAHGQEAQKRLLQTDKKAVVRVYYVVVAGDRSSTFQDGVHRPSSAEFWAQTFDLEGREKEAVDLALAMAQEAGAILRGLQAEAAESLRYVNTAVASYIATREDPTVVDWEFLAQRNMLNDDAVKAEGKRRHERARKAVADGGYTWPKGGRRGKDDDQVEALAVAAAMVPDEVRAELAEMLPVDDAE